MKIALIGAGKMGSAIQEISQQRGHRIALTIDSSTQHLLTSESLREADVAIEFTSPLSAFQNVSRCLEAGIPTVCGSTGWTSSLETVAALCRQLNGSFIYASNFSIGVNLFFELNKKLASLMATQPNYEVILEEIHHTQKKDAPSGTAITLAEQILELLDRKKQWVNVNGVLTSPESGDNIRTLASFDDFKLHIEFRYPKGSNSGVYLRGRYEIQIEDNQGKEPQSVYLGGVYGFIDPWVNAAKAAGEWQSYDVTLIGRMVTVVANGQTIIFKQEIPGITGGAINSDEGAPGPIMLQGDHGPIEYRNIIITPAKN